MSRKNAWLRAKRARERTAKNNSGKTPDVTYKVDFTTTKKGYWTSKSEGFKAIAESPEGTRVTVDFTFGGSTLYEVQMRGGGTKVLTAINEDGTTRMRGKVIRTASAVRDVLGNPRTITIHGRDLKAESREKRRRDEEYERWWKSLISDWKSKQAKRAVKR